VRALRRGAELEALVVAPRLLNHPYALDTVRREAARGRPVVEVTPEVYRSLSLAVEPQGLGAVVRQRWTPLAAADPAAGLCWVALDAVRNPGNLGTTLRTAEAVGAAGVVLVGEAADPHDPAAVRASMGAIFGQRLVRTTTAEFAAWVRRHGCQVVGTSPAGAVDYRAVRYRRPLVLFVGEERRGLTAEHRALCDALVRIPMVGGGDSLNLAVATAVVLYEVFGQRQAANSGAIGRSSAARR
jgi:RNA methyltransferase, TrmH family